MLGLRLRGGSNLELKVRLSNEEEIKIDIPSTSTVKQLKEKIYSVKNCLDVASMSLECCSIPLSDNDALVNKYIKQSGVTIIQSKCSLI